MSWSDGDFGIFVTDVAANTHLSVDGEAVADFLIFGFSFEGIDPQINLAAMELALGNIRLATCNDISIHFYPKGSRVRINTGRFPLSTVTLCVSAAALHDWAGPALPDALQSALDGEDVLVRLPVQIGRERDHLVEASVGLPYAPLFYRTKSSTLLWLLLDYLRRCDEEACNGKAVSNRVRSRLEQVRRSLDEAPGQRLSVDEMARRAGLNRTSLRALFKQVYGMRLSEYRTAQLMQQAERMLRTDRLSVTETAHALGYSDASSFSVAYKRQFGHPPGHQRITGRDSRRATDRLKHRNAGCG